MKRKAGRPWPKNHVKMVKVSFTISPSVLNQIDEIAKSYRSNRSKAIRLVIERNLGA